MMKFPWMEYEEDTNTFIIAFSSKPGEGGVSEVAPGVLVTLDAEGRLVAIELEGDVAKEYPEIVESLHAQSQARPLRKTGT